ncbi:MAG: hypothetical protein H6585_02610 [Flavobacteriales bacterium]|nr:hypothetical protein [Flavobacteriales bacterium]MCB9447220.1 hypothetical protein [Flavobacteriales bacterium]
MRTSVIIAVSAFAAFASCKKIDKLTEFDMPYETSVTIPSSVGMQVPFTFPTPDVASHAEETFSVNDTRKDKIEEIHLTELRLSISKPANGDFSFLKDVELYLAADGLSDQKVAWKFNIPANPGNTLYLETTDADLQAFVKKDTFKIKVDVVTDEVITQDYTIQVNAKFHVNARVLGI